MAEHGHWFAVHSATGVHIGLWDDGKIAHEVLSKYPGGTITELVEATPATAAANIDMSAIKQSIEDAILNASGGGPMGISSYERKEIVSDLMNEIRAIIARAEGQP